MDSAQRASHTILSRTSRRYRLKYYENEKGVEKAVEFSAAGFSDALALALDDPAERTVEIWEDGEFALRISRDLPEQVREKPQAERLVELLLDQPESDTILIYNSQSACQAAPA